MMMSRIKTETPQALTLAEAGGPFVSNGTLRSVFALGVLLSILGLAHSSLAAETVTAVPRVPQAHATINFSQMAQREAAAGLTALRTNQRVAPFISPLAPQPTNGGAAAAAVPNSAQASQAAPAGASPLSPQPVSSFQALDDDGTLIPPDTQGAVGPNHLMVALNSQIRIQDRTGVNLKTMSTFGFWSILGVQDVSDPHLAYDPYNGRWIFTMIADFISPASSILVAVSQTSDPTGNWFLFKSDADPSNVFWADYPTLGFNKDWVVVSVNMFSVLGNGYGGAYIYVFSKTNLYANGNGAFTFLKDANTPGLTLAPAVTYENSLSTLYLVDVDQMALNSAGNRLRISTITGSVGNEILTLGSAFAVAPTNNWGFYEPGFGGSAPQLGSSARIEMNDTRIINAVYHI